MRPGRPICLRRRRSEVWSRCRIERSRFGRCRTDPSPRRTRGSRRSRLFGRPTCPCHCRAAGGRRCSDGLRARITRSIVRPRPKLAARLRATHDRAAFRAWIAIDALAVQTSVQSAAALSAHPLSLRRAKLRRIRRPRFAARRIGFANADAGALAANPITRHVGDERARLAHLHFVEPIALARPRGASVHACAVLALRFAGRVLPRSAGAQLGLTHLAGLAAFRARVARAVRTAKGAARFGRLPRAVGVAQLRNRPRAAPCVRFAALAAARAASAASAARTGTCASVGSCATIRARTFAARLRTRGAALGQRRAARAARAVPRIPIVAVRATATCDNGAGKCNRSQQSCEFHPKEIRGLGAPRQCSGLSRRSHRRNPFVHTFGAQRLPLAFRGFVGAKIEPLLVILRASDVPG